MSELPYPLTATNIEDLKLQIWNLIRPLYEDNAFSKINLEGTEYTGSVAELNALDGISANGTSLIQAATYAAMLALLSGEAAAAFDFNSQNLTGVGNITLGTDGAGDRTILLYSDTAGSRFGLYSAGNYSGFYAWGDVPVVFANQGYGFMDFYTNATHYLRLGVEGNFDIKVHNGSTVGLKLGGTLVEKTAAQINAPIVCNNDEVVCNNDEVVYNY